MAVHSSRSSRGTGWEGHSDECPPPSEEHRQLPRDGGDQVGGGPAPLVVDLAHSLGHEVDNERGLTIAGDVTHGNEPRPRDSDRSINTAAFWGPGKERTSSAVIQIEESRGIGAPGPHPHGRGCPVTALGAPHEPRLNPCRGGGAASTLHSGQNLETLPVAAGHHPERTLSCWTGSSSRSLGSLCC